MNRAVRQSHALGPVVKGTQVPAWHTSVSPSDTLHGEPHVLVIPSASFADDARQLQRIVTRVVMAEGVSEEVLAVDEGATHDAQ